MPPDILQNDFIPFQKLQADHLDAGCPPVSFSSMVQSSELLFLWPWGK
jgi:hypothetical protein